jgi:hypothetical protein
LFGSKGAICVLRVPAPFLYARRLLLLLCASSH